MNTLSKGTLRSRTYRTYSPQQLPRLEFKKVIIKYGEMDFESWENSTEAEALPDDEARKTAWLKMCGAYKDYSVDCHEEDGEENIDGEEIWERTAEVYDEECVE